MPRFRLSGRWACRDDLIERLYPKFVSFLGSLGLGTALAYLFWGGYFYAAGNTLWIGIMLDWGPWLVWLPVGALAGHLYLRSHLGGWYLEQERIEAAAEYAGSRLEHSLLRGRREALWHRLYLGRAQMADGEYAEALATLTRGFAMPEAESQLAEYRRWQLEAALRLEDPEMIEEALDGAFELDASAETRAALRACAAEAALLDERREAYETHLEEARWLEGARTRVDFVEIMGTARFGRTDQARERALELIGRSRETGSPSGVPGRVGEWEALRAELLIALDRSDDAERTLREAEEMTADSRSREALDRVEQMLDANSF